MHKVLLSKGSTNTVTGQEAALKNKTESHDITEGVKKKKQTF